MSENLLIKNYYNPTKIKKFYRSINESEVGLKARIDNITESISDCSNKIRKELRKEIPNSLKRIFGINSKASNPQTQKIIKIRAKNSP